MEKDLESVLCSPKQEIEEDNDKDEEEEKVSEYFKRTREGKDAMEHLDGEFDNGAARIMEEEERVERPNAPRRQYLGDFES